RLLLTILLRGAGWLVVFSTDGIGAWGGDPLSSITGSADDIGFGVWVVSTATLFSGARADTRSIIGFSAPSGTAISIGLCPSGMRLGVELCFMDSRWGRESEEMPRSGGWTGGS